MAFSEWKNMSHLNVRRRAKSGKKIDGSGIKKFSTKPENKSETDFSFGKKARKVRVTNLKVLSV